MQRKRLQLNCAIHHKRKDASPTVVRHRTARAVPLKRHLIYGWMLIVQRYAFLIIAQTSRSHQIMKPATRIYDDCCDSARTISIADARNELSLIFLRPHDRSIKSYGGLALISHAMDSAERVFNYIRLDCFAPCQTLAMFAGIWLLSLLEPSQFLFGFRF